MFCLTLVPLLAQSESRTLKWAGQESEEFELEIYFGPEKELILNKTIQDNKFVFILPKPGEYSWRIKKKTNEKWSELLNFRVTDNILTDPDPLMIYPDDQEKVIVAKDLPRLRLKWRKLPIKGLKYYLELYQANSKEPYRTLQVQGKDLVVGFRKIPPALSWRLYAKSPWGNVNPSTQKNTFLLIPKKLNFFTQTYSAKLSYLLSNGSFDHDLSIPLLGNLKKHLSFSGSTTEAEFSGKNRNWGNNLFYNVSFRKTKLSSGIYAYDENQFAGNLEWKSNLYDKFSHSFLAGFTLNSINTQLIENLDADFLLTFATMGFKFNYTLDTKWALESRFIGLISTSNYSPGFKVTASANYQLNKDWTLSATTLLERISSSTGVSNSDNLLPDSFNFTFQQYGSGLELKYQF